MTGELYFSNTLLYTTKILPHNTGTLLNSVVDYDHTIFPYTSVLFFNYLDLYLFAQAL